MYCAQQCLRMLTFAVLGWVVPAAAAAQATPKAAGADEAGRWEELRKVFGQQGEADDNTFRVNFPRRDLTVRLGPHVLAPAFELTSYVAFAPTDPGHVLAMGEVVCRENEVPAVLEEARRQGISVPALHNHLINESPRIMYVHLMSTGEPVTLAHGFRAVVSRTAVPLNDQEEQKGDPGAWIAVNTVLGQPEEVGKTTAEYVFPRRERITEHGFRVPSTGALETASEVVFQRLNDGQTATGGELFVAPDEIMSVMQALSEGGIHVTAIHNHMVDETPRMYWLHWYAVGEPTELAQAIAGAIARTHSEQRSGRRAANPPPRRPSAGSPKG